MVPSVLRSYISIGHNAEQSPKAQLRFRDGRAARSDRAIAMSRTGDADASHAVIESDARLRHFRLLTRDQQAQAIRRLAATGMTDYDVSAATRLAVEQVRQILGEHSA
jgi:hypothetical protein